MRREQRHLPRCPGTCEHIARARGIGVQHERIGILIQHDARLFRRELADDGAARTVGLAHVAHVRHALAVESHKSPELEFTQFASERFGIFRSEVNVVGTTFARLPERFGIALDARHDCQHIA